MNTLKAGFSRVDVTPMLGTGIRGYFVPRYAEGVLDPLEVNTLALACGDEKAVILSVDNCGIKQCVLEPLRRQISRATGIPVAGVYIHATHTHTGPFVEPDSEVALEKEYSGLLLRRMADSVQLALQDLQPARMGIAVGQAPNIAFIRRFRMRDGSVRTNPGVNNPDILEPIGQVDERVNVLRFDREEDSLVLVNFGDHPDTVGGSKISADWPAFVRSTLEQAIPGVKCLFLNGAQGDVNHVNVAPKDGDLNDMFNDFDDVTRGYGHARHMGRVVAGGVLQVFDKVAYRDVNSLRCLEKTVRIPANLPAPEDLPEAHRINDLHEAGRDAELPYTGMMLTTVVAEAARMVRLEHGPQYFDMPMTGIAIGDVTMIGISGEPFTGIGRALKEAPGWALVLPTCNTGGNEGYFPMQDAYDEGGYEARASNFAPGVAELLIAEGTDLLSKLQ